MEGIIGASGVTMILITWSDDFLSRFQDLCSIMDAVVLDHIDESKHLVGGCS